jgi:hypothetical protein
MAKYSLCNSQLSCFESHLTTRSHSSEIGCGDIVFTLAGIYWLIVIAFISPWMSGRVFSLLLRFKQERPLLRRCLSKMPMTVNAGTFPVKTRTLQRVLCPQVPDR